MGHEKKRPDFEEHAFAFDAAGPGRSAIPNSGGVRAFFVRFGFDQSEHFIERSVGLLDCPVQLDNQDGETNIGKRSPTN